MEIKEVPLEKLKPSEYNPRAMNEKEAEDLQKSLEKFGMIEPIVVNKAPGRENVIIGGHQRYYLLKKMGKPTIPVVYVDIPKLEDEQELNLRLNKNLGHWDWALLANFDEKLLGMVGFSSEDIEDIFGVDLKEDAFDMEGELEKQKKPTSKYGKVYKLGKHRLMCGDSTKIEDVKTLMGGGKADMVFTDPPYNVDYISPSGGSYAKGKYKHKKIFSDNLTDEEYYEFLKDSLANAVAVTHEYAPFYWFHATRYYAELVAAFKEVGLHPSQVIIWVKDHLIMAPGQDYHHIFEPFLFGWKKGKKHYLNKKIANLTDAFALGVDRVMDILDVWIEKRDSIMDYIHPTQKPLGLAARAIRKSSKRDNIILDLFGGSGSTLIACEQMNRTCYMMELDPYYCDAIRKRYEVFKGTS